MKHFYPPPRPTGSAHFQTQSPIVQERIVDYKIKHEDLETLRLIGSGAYGEVFEGIYKPTQEKVAIKKLIIIKSDARSEELYRREVDVLSKVKHPYLLPFIGYTDTEPFCIVTKYIPNGSLYDHLHRDTNEHDLTGTELTVIAYGIASGMTYLHSLNAFHRDLKTQNILLTNNNIPIICDFGSTRKAESQNTMTMESAGTPNYMAPEFFQGGHYNKEVDVYSFGMMLWEMLTKEVPFYGLETPQVIYSVVFQKKRPEIPDTTPSKLKLIIELCWAQDPKERPSFDKIAQLFKSGEVQFPGNNRQNFIDKINQYLREEGQYCINSIPTPNTTIPIPSPSRPSVFSIVSSSPKLMTVSPSQGQRSSRHRDSLPINLLQPNELEKNTMIEKKALAYLQTLNEKTPQFVLEFFNNHIDDNTLPQIKSLWPPFLELLNKAPPEMHQQVYSLTIKFAQNHDILNLITYVTNLSDYVSDNTMDLLLYVVDFCPQAIDVHLVQQLMNFSIQTEKSSMKAVILLYKIMISIQIFQVKILIFFQSKVIDFVNRPGGEIMLKAIFLFNVYEPKFTFSYAHSNNIQNVIAAYEVNFNDPNGKAEYFTLDAVLKKHMLSKSEKLRMLSFEYIRRFAEGAQNGPLNEICISLLQAASLYESEEAILLLCNIAARPGPVCPVFISTAKKWLLTDKPKTFLNLFLVLLENNNAKREFVYLTETYIYLTHLIKANQPEVFLIICFVIKITCLNAQVASLFSKSKIADYVAIQTQKVTDFDDLQLATQGIINLAQYTDSPYFSDLVKHFFSLLSRCAENPDVSKLILTALNSLVKQKSTYKTFTDANPLAIFRRLNDPKGELAQYENSIISVLQKGGEFGI
ncbi:hypothetical protein M9Y10_017966 [Tritrichomonas musculus]|uniref:Protein kinase domain-containing protein n=1 Tax=Tritrichomonas musculus TaxID=1915356 RepID=A0ABR2HWK0_9EUKA